MEAPAGTVGEVLCRHRNTEGELVTIEKVVAGGFAGQRVLCIYDDATPVVAPTLLDEGTVAWLRGAL